MFKAHMVLGAVRGQKTLTIPKGGNGFTGIPLKESPDELFGIISE